MFLPRLNNYQKDIIPFKHIINNDCDALLIAHILIKGKTGIYPASLSRKFIQKELRDKLGYNGLIITDELRMKGVSLLYGTKRAVRLAMFAGNDIICCKYHKHNIEKYIKMGTKLVTKGKIDLRPAYQRIKDCKEKYHVVDKNNYSNIDVDKYNKQMKKILESDVK
jgi:beta-glucosidase-like glycosyl hydrolase